MPESGGSFVIGLQSKLTLFHPRREQWREHFAFQGPYIRD
jgi:hypothetical protein